MEEIERCTRCVLPTSLPSVTLDENGVCNHCNKYDKLFGNWEDIETQKRREFENYLQKAKRLNRNYDCLIALSGGKDSTYALYLCSKVYDLKCLCVTFDNGFLSGYAKKNIKNAIDATNADHIYYNVNHHLMMILFRLFLVKCGNFCPVCMRGINLVTHMSEYYNTPLAVTGGGRRIAYMAQHPEVFQSGDNDYFRKVLKGEPVAKIASQMYRQTFSSQFKWMMRQGLRVLRVSIPFLQQHTIGIHNYIYTPVYSVMDILKKEMGWTRPDDGFEHMDCLLHNIAFYGYTLKFPGITPTTFHNSGLIRLGQMNRDEAIVIEKNYLDNPQAPPELDSFLGEIKMSRDEYEYYMKDWKRLDKFRSKKEKAFIAAVSRVTRI